MSLRNYVLGAAAIWVAILLASAVVLSGTPYFVQILPLLAAGAGWCVILGPILMARGRR